MLFHAMHSIVFQNNMQTEYILNTNRKDYKTINSVYTPCAINCIKLFTHTRVCVCVCVCVRACVRVCVCVYLHLLHTNKVNN